VIGTDAAQSALQLAGFAWCVFGGDVPVMTRLGKENKVLKRKVASQSWSKFG